LIFLVLTSSNRLPSRGEESAELIKPRKKKIALLGLGYSVGTPPEGITAEAIVVTSFADLKSKSDQVQYNSIALLRIDSYKLTWFDLLIFL